MLTQGINSSNTILVSSIPIFLGGGIKKQVGYRSILFNF